MRIQRVLSLVLAMLMLAGCAQTSVQQEQEARTEQVQQEAVSETADAIKNMRAM